MPEFNRRRFLQFVGAAGLAPALPAMPASAAVAPTGTPAQMLWASLAKRATSTSAAGGIANSMGMSGATAQGVFAKMGYANIVVPQSAAKLSQAARSVPAVKTAPIVPSTNAPRVKVDVVKFLTEDADANPEIVSEALDIPEGEQ